MSFYVQLTCGLLALMLLKPMIPSVMGHGGNDDTCPRTCGSNYPDCPTGCACVIKNSDTGTCVNTTFPDDDFPAENYPDFKPE
uniref:Basic tail secreted protein n=1 Tax=Rhipicephalus appendiculatus TaxID=34631 RepID=A0A131Y9A5_RHIAP